MSGKKRLDILLVERGLAETRQKAQATIMSGIVYVNGQKADKAGFPTAEDAEVEVRGNVLPYVSRGGLKLEKAMNAFDLALDGFVCADIGASTGGFTDCMLQTARRRSTPSTSATGSLTGSCETTRVSCVWSGRTRAISRMSRCRTSWTLPRSTSRSSRCG